MHSYDVLKSQKMQAKPQRPIVVKMRPVLNEIVYIFMVQYIKQIYPVKVVFYLTDYSATKFYHLHWSSNILSQGWRTRDTRVGELTAEKF